MLDATAVNGIVEHMNEDHADAVLLYAQGIASMPLATAALITRLHSDAMCLEVQTPAGTESVRIEFDAPLIDRAHARQALIALVDEARQRLLDEG